MVSGLIRFALRSPFVVLVICVALVAAGWRAFEENPKDAIPDIAENQTIVFTQWAGRSPKDIDEQVTYPLTVALQGVPGVRDVRATSGFGWSTVYVVFHDDIEFYWARSRVLERLNVAQAQLPEGVIPSLGPDATALGQIFWYTVENGWYCPTHPGLRFESEGSLSDASRNALIESDPSLSDVLDRAAPGRCPILTEDLVFSTVPLDQLRSIQDFDVKLALESVEGVSEVASIGGYVRQYQIDVNPDAMRAYGVALGDMVKAVKQSNVDVGAKVIDENGMEILVRGVGFLGGGERSMGSRKEREQAAIRDIENIVVKAVDGTPTYVRQLGGVTTGPDFRRGALDKMGAEAVGGCVVMRYLENPITIIDRVKEKIPGIEAGFPPGVRISAFYDRSGLIDETMNTLGSALRGELIITVVVVVLFLLHFRSSVVIAVTLPLAILFAFVCMQALDLGSNIMSLAGIAIAIGTMVDMGIVMTENIYQYLTDHKDEYTSTVADSNGEEQEVVDHANRQELVQRAATEVGSAILTAVSTTVVSFLPVFFLEGQSAKLFTPLAWTKTFCLVGAVVMALVVVPPFSSLMLRHKRSSIRATALVSFGIGVAVAITYSMILTGTGHFAATGERLRSYLGLPQPLDLAIVGLCGFVLTWIVMRERIKPIERNIFSRLIHCVYEPVLRWILHHKLLFLTLPAAILTWGFSIWLGWSPFVGLILRPVEFIGVMEWSEAWWIHLGFGLFAGLFVLPLVVDTIMILFLKRKGPLDGSPRPWIKTLFLTAGIAFAGLFHVIGCADRSYAMASSIFVSPPPADDGEPTPLREFSLIASLIGESRGIGQEFMPPLDEGDFLYMPSVLPAGSINTAVDVMRKQDIQFAEIPEVNMVVGKLGRIESALDSAPVGMLETVITLKPRAEWPYIDDPEIPGRTRRRTMNEIWDQITKAGQFPGVLPSVQLQPIRTRVEMLSTGLNAKIGLKVYGDSLERCEEAAVAIEALLRDNLKNAEAINAVRVNGKPYLEFHIDREAIARYGVNIRDVQNVIEVAIGGMNLTTTFEGLDRYPVRIRYERELRDSTPALERILVPTPAGAQIPISLLADIQSVIGPMSVRREGAKFVSYVTMNNVGIDETSLVARGQAIIDQAIIDGTLKLPEGLTMKWAGSYERNLRAKKRLAVLVPLVLLINFILIYMQFHRFPLTVVVFLAIPVAFAGGFILLEYWPAIQDRLYLSGIMDRGFEGDAMYLTVAVWVGFIALFGIAVDDGIVIGTYLDQTFGRSRITRFEEIEERVVEAGRRRIRPCLMTTFTTLAALVPVMISTGRGSDVLVPMAIPVFGGMLIALVTLFIVPASYCGLKQIKWVLRIPDPDFERTFTS